MTDTRLEAAAPPRTSTRLIGVDLARVVALYGMFVVHLDLTGLGATVSDDATSAQSGWTVAKLFEGRAMPLFVLLSGIGLTLLLRSSGGRPAAVLGRAAVLLVLGVLMSGTGSIAVILHFYALYLVLGLLAHRLPDRWLLVATVGVAVVGVAVQIWLARQPDPAVESLDAPTSYLSSVLGSLHPVELAQDLFLTGVYPFLPDGAFFLAGMWIGRRSLGSTRTALRLVAAGVVLLLAGAALVTALAPVVRDVGIRSLATDLVRMGTDLTPAGLQRFAQEQGGTLESVNRELREAEGFDLDDVLAVTRSGRAGGASTTQEILAALGRYAPHDHLPAWLLGATGGALLVLGLCLLLARFLPQVSPLAAFGRLSLSAYVAHWAFVVWVDPPWVRQHGLATAGLLWIGLLLLALLWSRRFGTGPVEALTRGAGRLAARAVDAVRRRTGVRRRTPAPPPGATG